MRVNSLRNAAAPQHALSAEDYSRHSIAGCVPTTHCSQRQEGWFPRQLRHRPGLAPLSVAAAFALLVALAVAACSPGINGSGHVKTESRPVSGFTSVHLSGVGHLIITQTGTESLSITTDDNILPLITASVSNGTLSIGVKPGNSIGKVTQLDYTLTVKTLREIDVSGAATVTATGITTGALTLSLSGASNATVSGQAPTLTLTISGAGNFNGRQLASQTATVTISGAGSASVAASNTLDATISGAGSITYYGNPHVTQHISGAGSIKQG